MLPEDEILRGERGSDEEPEYINRSQRFTAVVSRNFAATGCLGFILLLIVGFIYSFFVAENNILEQTFGGWRF